MRRYTPGPATSLAAHSAEVAAVIDSGWRRRAACREEDPELFYPPGTTGPALAQLTQAKAICARCPVAAQCLAWALATDEQFGVWGGKSEEERKAMRPRRRPP